MARTDARTGGLTVRYLLALALVAGLATTSFLLLREQIRSQEAHGVVINVAGKQRMLSQRAPRMLLEILAAPDEELEQQRRDDLRAAIALMRTDHRALVDGDPERHIPAEHPPAVDDAYGSGLELDARVMAFLATLDSLTETPRESLVNDPRLQTVLNDSRKQLLADLNSVVGMYEAASTADVAAVQRMQRMLLGAMLAMLALIGLVLFRPMVARIRRQVDALVEHERSMQLVLDNTQDGLLLVDLEGAIQSTRSRAATGWFGEPDPGQRVWDLLFANHADRRSGLALGWEDLEDGFLPLEVMLDQFPARVERDGSTFGLDYRPVHDEEGELTHVLVAIRDLTETLALERAERRGREVQRLIGHALRDRYGVEVFVDDVQRILDQLTRPAELEDGFLQRGLHTIKGNASAYDLHSIAERAHDLEDRLADDPESCDAAVVVDELGGDWNALLADMEEFLAGPSDSIQISSEEHSEFLSRVRAAGRPELLKIVRSWRSPRFRSTLERLERQAQRLATDLGRELDVHVRDHGVRLDVGDLRGFTSSLVHAVRNAVDHGVETPDERTAQGKPRRATVVLESTFDGSELRVSVSDDGRGIDWEQIRERATERGLPHATEADLIEALFHDGLSTRDEVSATSGRGVGMAALRREIEERHGRVVVDSTPGAGTRWTFVLPRRRMLDRTLGEAA